MDDERVTRLEKRLDDLEAGFVSVVSLLTGQAETQLEPKELEELREATNTYLARLSLSMSNKGGKPCKVTPVQ